MIIETPYDQYEIINKIRERICTVEEHDNLKISGKDKWPKYYGTVTDDAFQLCKIGNNGKGGQHLIIIGRVIRKDNKVYITYKPMLNSNHINVLFLMCSLLIYTIVKRDRITIIPLIALSVGMLLEYRKMYCEYFEFKEFINDL